MQVADLAPLEDGVGGSLHLGVEAFLLHGGVDADKAFVVVGEPGSVASALRELPAGYRRLQRTSKVAVPSFGILP